MKFKDENGDEWETDPFYNSGAATSCQFICKVSPPPNPLTERLKDVFRTDRSPELNNYLALFLLAQEIEKLKK